MTDGMTFDQAVELMIGHFEHAAMLTEDSDIKAYAQKVGNPLHDRGAEGFLTRICQAVRVVNEGQPLSNPKWDEAKEDARNPRVQHLAKLINESKHGILSD